MTPNEAANILGCSTQQVRTLIRTGKLKAKKRKTDPTLSGSNQYGFAYLLNLKDVRRLAKIRQASQDQRLSINR